MKKFFKAAIATAMVCFSASLFAAAPSSFLKGTTYDLFEDEVVDNFAWGLEDITGLVLGGYDATTYNFNVGAGAWLGPLWYSVYDTGSFAANVTTTKEATADTVAQDGVNTDYVNVTKDSNNYRNSQNINNNLYFSVGTGDWGIQSYWFLNDWTGSGNYGKETHSEEDKLDGTSSTTDNKYTKYYAYNTFGANFKGIGTAEPEDDGLYLELTDFKLQWLNNTNNEVKNEVNKKNGTTYYTRDVKKKDAQNKFYPSVTGKMGFGLPALGNMSTKFVLTENFNCDFTFYKPTTVTTTVREDINSKTTTKKTETWEKNSNTYKFHWTNTLTPNFIFDFDVGERLSLKASAFAEISVKNNPASTTSYKTTVTETTTYNNITHLTSSTYHKQVQADGIKYGTNTNYGTPTDPVYYWIQQSLITSVSPYTSLAFVYQVKPEKFNLNLGAKWRVGSYTWTTTTKKKATVKETDYQESTNEAGTKTVTNDEETYTRPEGYGSGDGWTESTSTNFTAYNSSFIGLNIGATWFITEAAQLDIAYSGTFGSGDLRIFNGGTGGLLGSALKLNFIVKF